MLKKTFLSTAIVSILAGCGGGSDNSTEPDDSTLVVPPSSEEVSIKVIDGYLESADVCLIAEGSDSCEFIGTTNEEGYVNITNDRKGLLVATITAGQAKDADQVGFVSSSYQMSAELDENSTYVITPYTTLDVLYDDKTMADIAADLSLPLELIEGDYVDSTLSEQAHVHALARAMTQQLSADVDNNDLSTLYDTASQINDYINSDLVNSGEDLSSVNITISNGVISHSAIISSLKDFLEQAPLYMTSINTSAFASEGVREVVFDNGTVTVGNFTASYSVNGDLLTTTADGDSETDLFLYASSQLSLSVPINNKDLTVMATEQFGNGLDLEWKEASWLESGLSGQTKYLVFDDASITDEEPNPSFTKIYFDNDTVTITENGESFTVPWSMDPSTGIFELELGDLAHSNLKFAEIISDGQITILNNVNSVTPPTLMFDDEALAQSIYQQWQGLQ